MITHLLELRRRLLRCLVVVLVIFCGLFAFANDLYQFMAEPLLAYLPPGGTMIATDVTSPFLVPFKLVIVLAVFLAIPFILHQTWAFIAPGLYRNERCFARVLLVGSVVLFYAGAGFAYTLVFPLVFGFFTQVGPDHVAIMTDISHYLNFVLKLLLAFGLAFEIPVIMLLLVHRGLIHTTTLQRKRPYVVVLCFVVGMLLTPPDVISQSLLAIPMWLLFEMGLLLARWID